VALRGTRIPYELKVYDRDKVTRLAPPEYKKLHPLGAAPVIHDGDVCIAESGAIVDYIAAKYGNGRLVLKPEHPTSRSILLAAFRQRHLQPATGRNMLLNRLDLPADNPLMAAMRGRLMLALDSLEARLEVEPVPAGADFTSPISCSSSRSRPCGCSMPTTWRPTGPS